MRKILFTLACTALCHTGFANSAENSTAYTTKKATLTDGFYSRYIDYSAITAKNTITE